LFSIDATPLCKSGVVSIKSDPIWVLALLEL